MTTYCPYCSAEITSIDKFCEKCGKEISSSTVVNSNNKLKNYQFALFPAIVFLMLVAILWYQLKADSGVITNIIVMTIVFFLILLFLDYQNYSYRKFLYIVFFIGIVYSILLFNLVGVGIAIVGFYFASPNNNINTSLQDKTKSDATEKFVVSSLEHKGGHFP